jgi:hypothetical protein
MQLFCGYAVVQLVEALRYQLEGREIDSQGVIGFVFI